MIKCYFGVPGCGKSTILVREWKKNRKKYKHVYTINLEIKGVEKITKEDFQNYRFEDSLILWDEITLDYDNRDFKKFTLKDKQSWLLHRHMGVDIIYATQNYENVDKKIKDLTQELWYMNKSVVPFLRSFTKAKRIYRNININEYSSELTMGYRFCNFIEGLFVSNTKIIWRKRFYKYFNSWDTLGLEERELYENKKDIYNNNIIDMLNNI